MTEAGIRTSDIADALTMALANEGHVGGPVTQVELAAALLVFLDRVRDAQPDSWPDIKQALKTYLEELA